MMIHLLWLVTSFNLVQISAVDGAVRLIQEGLGMTLARKKRHQDASSRMQLVAMTFHDAASPKCCKLNRGSCQRYLLP